MVDISHGVIRQQQFPYSLLTRIGFKICAVELHVASAENHLGQDAEIT